MIRLAIENSPVEAAWAAYDAAAISLHAAYAAAADFETEDTAAARGARMRASEEVLRLWDAWRTLFLGTTGPGEAA